MLFMLSVYVRPQSIHYIVVYENFLYIHGMMTQGLVFSSTSKLEVQVYYDF